MLMKLPIMQAMISPAIAQNPSPSVAKAAPMIPKNKRGSPMRISRISIISMPADTGGKKSRDILTDVCVCYKSSLVLE